MSLTNILTGNNQINRQIRLLRPAIGAIIRGNVRPLIGYFSYLSLEKNIKAKLLESFAGEFETLSTVLYYCGFYSGSQILSLLALEKPIIVEFPDMCKLYIRHLIDFACGGLYYELETFKFVMKQIKNCKVFVDVGANIGGYAIRAAKYCKVYAIEPLPRNYKILKINEKLNNVKINSFNIAAGNKNGKVKLYYKIGDWGGPSIKRELNEFIEVEMKPLDEIINEESIDLIKIDVEGAEDLVLEGARNCLRRTKMVIIEKNKESFPNAYKILKEEGFRPKEILDRCNILFIKNENIEIY
jgi:FkbM family methyltransferase